MERFPSIASVWDKLPQSARDEYSRKVMQWLIKTLRSISKTDALVLAQVLSYHGEEVRLALQNALKPQVRERIDTILRVLGVG